MKGSRAVQSKHPSIIQIREQLTKIKNDALRLANERLAKKIWCYETILSIQEDYAEAFRCLRRRNFYKAWCLYEKVEIALLFLGQHFLESNGEYRLEFIAAQTSKFQSLFPYALFFSTAILQKEVRCSICNARLGLRTGCGHVIGEIYAGKLCCRMITDLDLLEISVVTEPVNKYAVGFLKDEATGKTLDQHDYKLASYVASGLVSPFHGWEIEWTTRREPHSLFADLEAHDKCPCGGGKPYGECCLSEEGVLRRHAIVTFEFRPPADLPALVHSAHRVRARPDATGLP